ncbi:MAG: ABC transporter permease [Acidobacteriia bacterium]|nr:ABC transporter permease [Terriglobia bacterium]
MGWTRFFRRGFWDKERSREIQSYIEIETDENIARGMSPEEARYAAHKKFGNVASVREEIYHMNTIGFLESLWQDLRYTFRSLRRNRGFAATAIITLALGIGANTTVFSALDAAMFRPLPYRDPSRLVTIAWVAARGSAEQVTYLGGASLQEMEDWRAQKQIFGGVEPFSLPPSTGVEEPVAMVYISAGMLDLLGVQPRLGRGFLPEEGLPGRDQVALLSHSYWLREFDSDPAILGKTIRLDGRVYTIVGVMPSNFQFPPGSKPNAWAPWTEKVESNPSIIARLRPGLSNEQAERETALVSDRIHYSGRVPRAKMTPEFLPVSDRLNSWLGFNRNTRTALLIMMGAVGFVLLIACANVANLLLSRSAKLQREVAIRSAIGASRGRLVRHFLVESMVLAAAGALAAVLLTWWLTHAIPTLLPADLRRLFATYELALSKRVFAFTVAVTVLTCLLSGLIPAFRTAHGGVIGGLIGTGRTAGVTRATRRLHIGLQSLQVGLALVLLCGAGLMANSFVRMTLTDSCFDTRNLCLVRVSLPQSYPKGPERQAFYDQLLSIVKTLPAVQSAILAAGTPTSLGFGTRKLFAEDALGAGAEPWGGDLLFVGADYFSTLRIPMVAGRDFGPEDGPSSPLVAVIDRRTAEHYWPGQSALGRRIRAGSGAPWVTVVGVVASVKTPSFTSPKGVQIYKPISQGNGVVGSNLIIRTAGDPRPVLAEVRARIADFNPGATVRTAATFDELYETMDAEAAATPRFYLILMSIFAGVALATAAVGIYGVLSYSVAQRSSEIGVRMALGATAHDVHRLVVRSILLPVGAGIVGGVIVSLWLTRLLRSLLYQITPHDPLTIVLVATFLLLVSLAASYLPSRRATRIDPMTALRIE